MNQCKTLHVIYQLHQLWIFVLILVYLYRSQLTGLNLHCGTRPLYEHNVVINSAQFFRKSFKFMFKKFYMFLCVHACAQAHVCEGQRMIHAFSVSPTSLSIQKVEPRVSGLGCPLKSMSQPLVQFYIAHSSFLKSTYGPCLCSAPRTIWRKVLLKY